MQAQFIKGGIHIDERGAVSHINSFKMDEVKRLYSIQNSGTNIIRAWQGHRVEKKWFFVTAGAFKFAVIKPDDWDNPSPNLPINVFTLTSGNTGVLYVPGGNATGFKALEASSKLIVFSNLTLEESQKDDFRFNAHFWADWRK